jgi:hypothetical protein
MWTRRPLRALALLGAAALCAAACHEYHFQPRDYKGEIDIPDDLFAVAVPSADHVVAVGYWGAIYVSSDGGTRWKKAESGTQKLLYDVSMADTKVGWCVGQLGLILRTEDGGATWRAQANSKQAEGANLLSVVALDEKRAWAIGDWGTRIYTSDGGRTWVDYSLTIDEKHPQFVWLALPDQDRVRKGQKVYEDVGLTDVSCLPGDRDRCWMIGEFGYIFHTENGGLNPDHTPSWERGEIVGGLKLDPIEMGYNVIELSEEQRESVLSFAKQIAGEQHLNVAIEPRVTEAEIRAFGMSSDPSPLFEIIEARTQEIQAAVEEAGILSDRIRRRGAPPWDYEDFIDDDPDFLKRYYESRKAPFSGRPAEGPDLRPRRHRAEEPGRRAQLEVREHRAQAGAVRGAALRHARDRGRREGPDAGLGRRRGQLARAPQLPDHLHVHARHRLRPRRPGRLHRGPARDRAALGGQRAVLEADPPGTERDPGRGVGRVGGGARVKPARRPDDASSRGPRGASPRPPEVSPGVRP